MKKLVAFLVPLAIATVVTIVVKAQGTYSPQDSSYLEQFRGEPASKIVPQVWLDECRLNRIRYPDSNMVRAGDTLLLPTNKRYIVEGNQGSDHMWRAAMSFAQNTVLPYLNHHQNVVSTVANTSKTAILDPILFWFLIAAVLLILLVMLWFIRKNLLDRRHPFVARQNIPDFENASDEEVEEVVENALRQIYGRNFEIVGPIQRGYIDGTMTSFFANGSQRNEEFHDEPGFRARLRFNDRHERLVVSRWSCFNPCWTAQDAQFSGTFTPVDEMHPQRIDRITNEELGDLTQNIRRTNRGEEPAVDPIPPAEPKEEARVEGRPGQEPKPESQKETPAPAVEKTEEGKLHFTKVQISNEKGLNLEGNFDLTPKELQELITRVTSPGKTGEGEEKDK